MPTIKDVAKKANVSISTVSYAINGTRSISEETKKRVLEAAKELGYQPNGIARSLKMKNNRMIAVVVNEFHGPIYQEILRGITRVAKDYQYEVIAAECFSNKSQLTRVLSQKFVDGAIILASYIKDEVIENLASEKFPIVVLDRQIKGEYITSILIDNEDAAYEVARHFKEKGFEEVGFLGGPKDSYDNNKRLEGFRKGIEAFNLVSSSKWTLTSDFTQEGGYKTIKKCIEEEGIDCLPRAIFSANDEMAIGAMKALKEYNILIPEQVALVGFDNIELCQYVMPPLTTVHRPCYELGVAAAKSLIEHLNGENVIKAMTLSSEFIIRSSC